MRTKKLSSVFLLIVMITGIFAGIFTGCNTESEKSFQSIEDFNQAKIGVITGSSHDQTAKKFFPNATRVYFNNMSDMILAVEQGKIDTYLEDEAFLAPLIWEGINLKRIDEAVTQMNNGFVFPEGENTHLREQLNKFLGEATADGTVERLRQKWLGETEPTEHPDYMGLTGENGTIRLAISVDNKPMLYQNAEGFTGLEMDLLTVFGQRYGYKFDIEVVPFESIIAGISANKYDMGASSLNITAEREESVDFTVPYKSFEVVLVVKNTEKKEFRTLKDIQNATLGIVTGTSWDLVAQKDFPNAQRKYFSSTADILVALEQGKIDAYFSDNTVFAGIQWENDAVTCIDEPIEMVSNALILPKEEYDANLLAQLNAFIAKSKSNGTLDMLAEKWFSATEPTEHPDYTKLTGENGTLKIAVIDSMKPTSYQKGAFYTGYEVDFLTLFAEEHGYKLEIKGMTFEALIPSVASGKYDIGASGITITPERAESVMFTDPHFETYGVAVIRNASNSSSQAIQSLEDLAGGSVAVLTGSIWDGIAKQQLPDTEIKYFSGMTDMFLALNQGKVDAILGDETFYVNARWENTPFTTLENTIGTINCGMIMAKDNYNPDLLEQLNAFIAQSRNDGTIEALKEKWLSDAEPTEHPDYSSLTGENGTLKIAVENAVRPITYQKNDGFTGFDVELLTKFAAQYGYRLEFSGMSFDALIPTVSAGKCDIGICGIAITEERSESVTFTDCYVEINGVVIVKESAPEAPQKSFWDGVRESFEKTFIREDRWKLILEGIDVTMLISVCSALAGSLLGFGLYMLSRSDVKLIQSITKGFAKGYSRIIAGTPIIVILMILFYVIFGKIRDMNGIVVAILGFTLVFGAFVYDHMTVSVGSVDRGQIEAAYALGYTKNKTFFRIIFPQAMSIFFPSYCGQAVELIKATAVVGYIAVNDLTKMGDIIRSNTYEAFFPLIATAVIYFFLTWALALLLKLVQSRFEPKRRSAENILKGVKIK